MSTDRDPPTAAASSATTAAPAVSVAVPCNRFDPHAAATWQSAGAVPYIFLATTFEAVAATTKRLEIADALSNMFRAILASTPDDLLPAVYLTMGKVAPDHDGVELNVGGKTVSDAVCEVAGTTRRKMSSLYKDMGDLGDVAHALRGRQAVLKAPAPLAARGVYAELLSLIHI